MYMEQMKNLIHKKRTSKCVNITKQYKKMINYDDDTKGNIKYHNSERPQFFLFYLGFSFTNMRHLHDSRGKGRLSL